MGSKRLAPLRGWSSPLWGVEAYRCLLSGLDIRLCHGGQRVLPGNRVPLAGELRLRGHGLGVPATSIVEGRRIRRREAALLLLTGPSQVIVVCLERCTERIEEVVLQLAASRQRIDLQGERLGVFLLALTGDGSDGRDVGGELTAGKGVAAALNVADGRLKTAAGGLAHREQAADRLRLGGRQ